MNNPLITYWRECRTYVYRWTAAILIFVLFVFVMEGYFDYFDHFR